MIDLCVQRRGEALICVSASDRVEILRLPERRVISISATLPAPPKIQRWYRAGVQLLVEATGRWPNREIAHREILMRAGYFEAFVISQSGDTRYTPASTRGWDFVEWREFVDRALPVLMEFAGESRAEFRDRVDRFFGISLKEALNGQ